MWLQLRQAQDALRQQRLDEARQLLVQPLAEGYRKAWRLARELARAYARRGQQAWQRRDLGAAWSDLLAGESLCRNEPRLVELRNELVRYELRSARVAIGRYQPREALLLISRLRERQVPEELLEGIETLAQGLDTVLRLADEGQLPQALEALGRLKPPEWAQATVAELREELQDRRDCFYEALPRLFAAVEQKQWAEVVAAADQVLAVAPIHQQALQLRESSLQRLLGPETAVTVVPPDKQPTRYAPPVTASFVAASARRTGWPLRFLLWVDGVGGYLVCLSPRVSLGRAAEDRMPDIPVFADLSRFHIEIVRDGDAFLLETCRPDVRLNGQLVSRAVLTSGDRVTLADTCQFTFYQPHRLSLTARLEINSGHRLPWAVHGVLLMGNEVLFSNSPESHVLLPRLPGTVALCRCPEGLGVRPATGVPVEIDLGQGPRKCSEWAVLPGPAHVSMSPYSLSLEWLEGNG